MTFALKTLARFLRMFRREEDGSPSVEFVLVFMPFMLLPVSGFEIGLLMTRHVMLERGIDMAVREVRLNTGAPITEDQLKRMICNSAGILPDCMNNLFLEMRTIDLRFSGQDANNTVPREASCTDVVQPYETPRVFDFGSANEMMIVRACGRFAPMLPEFALGYFLSRMDAGYYRVVSTTAFVMEPV